MEDDLVFKAMADSSRRKLLDLLFERDGQTLSELYAHLADAMTRFGCMKHLDLLEQAGLIVTRKVGREKFHYLNPVPIQQVYQRWVSKYAQPFAAALIDLKATLEDNGMSRPDHVFRIYIRTTPEQLWRALTDGEMTRLYYMHATVQSDWSAGSAYQYLNPQGVALVDGRVLESDPPRRLVTTFRPGWRTDDEGQRHTKVTFEIEPIGATCKLTLTHEDLDPASTLTADVVEGWGRVLSGLKTLLETGEPLNLSD